MKPKALEMGTFNALIMAYRKPFYYVLRLHYVNIKEISDLFSGN